MNKPKVGVNGVKSIGYDEPEEHYEPRCARDFDFPMSGTFRAASFEYCNLPDPGYVPPAPEPQTQVIEHRHSDMSKQDYDLLQQVSRKADWLETKLSKRKKKTQDYY